MERRTRGRTPREPENLSSNPDPNHNPRPSNSRSRGNENIDDMEFEFLDENEMDLEQVVNINTNRPSNRNRIDDIRDDLERSNNGPPPRQRSSAPNNSSVQRKEMPTGRTKLGRNRDAEEFINSNNNQNNPNYDNNNQDRQNRESQGSEQDIEDSDIEYEEDELRGNRRSRNRRDSGSDTVDTDRGSSRDNNAPKTTALGFLQSVFLIILSGIILLIVTVFGWTALRGMSSQSVYDDISQNIGILNGDDIESGTNKTWDMYQGLKEDVEYFNELELEYIYSKKDKLIKIKYGENTLNLGSEGYDLKFKKKGVVLVEIVTDSNGDLISYTILDTIK